jgi:hypothetical protein
MKKSSSSSAWQFSIDTGGTFTDGIARDPQGRVYRRKVLSSGVSQEQKNLAGTRQGMDKGRRVQPRAVMAEQKMFYTNGPHCGITRGVYFCGTQTKPALSWISSASISRK